MLSCKRFSYFVAVCERGLIARFVKNQAIKHRVDQVASSASKNEAHANNKTTAKFLFDDLVDIEHAKNDGYQSKNGQCYFAPRPAFPKFPAPGHAFVLNKMEPEPTTYNKMFVPIGVIGFDIKFKRLVCN